MQSFMGCCHAREKTLRVCRQSVAPVPQLCVSFVTARQCQAVTGERAGQIPHRTLRLGEITRIRIENANGSTEGSTEGSTLRGALRPPAARRTACTLPVLRVCRVRVRRVGVACLVHAVWCGDAFGKVLDMA